MADELTLHDEAEPVDASLLDLVDHVLDQGLVIDGHVTLGLANVDLIYLRLSVLLASVDRVFPGAGRS